MEAISLIYWSGLYLLSTFCPPLRNFHFSLTKKPTHAPTRIQVGLESGVFCCQTPRLDDWCCCQKHLLFILKNFISQDKTFDISPGPLLPAGSLGPLVAVVVVVVVVELQVSIIKCPAVQCVASSSLGEEEGGRSPINWWTERERIEDIEECPPAASSTETPTH